MGSPFSTSYFYPDLYRRQLGLCAWCGRALKADYAKAGVTVVDHDHRCCSVGRTCGNCVRGAVCHWCNVTEIRYADWAYDNGLFLPDWMHAYITSGESMVNDRSMFIFMADTSEYELPECLSAEEEYMQTSFDQELTAEYPFLAMQMLQEKTAQEIADTAGLPLRTTERRIASDKRKFFGFFCKTNGLVLEGDETIAELQEAYGHLKMAGR